MDYSFPSFKLGNINKKYYSSIYNNIIMPFQSRSQLRTCYGRQTQQKKTNGKKGWNCKQWLSDTNSVCCLPEIKGMPVKSRCMRSGERIVGPIKTGSRGGKYFEITEKDNKGTICTVKIYIPKSRKY